MVLEVTHAVVYDPDPDIPMWMTACGVGPLTLSIAFVCDYPSNCIACLAALEDSG